MATSGKAQKKQLGGIEHRGIGGQYRARARIDGKTFTKTFETEAGARAWLDDLRAKGCRPDRKERSLEAASLTLGQALRKRLELTASNKNCRNDLYAVDRLERDYPDLCSKCIYDIDELDILWFIEDRREEVAPATVNRDLCVISHTFNLARTKLGCTHLRNPIGKTTRLKVPPGRVRRLSAQEEAALLSAAATDEVTSSVSIGSIIRFACETAMRLGEIANMSWDHVDLDRGTVYLPDTKNGEARSVPLWLEMRALLRELGPKATGPVWGTREGIRSAWRRVKAAAIRAATESGDKKLAESLADFRFHDLRHEGTSRLIERTGWENAKIQAITGHKTAAMLARYTHLRSADLASQMAALEGGRASLHVFTPKPATPDESLPAGARQRLAWQAVSENKELLSALVASRPITDLASDFGVSDVTIHKACGKLGIAKPGRGYWLRAANISAA